MNSLDQIKLIDRQVINGNRDGKPTKIIVGRREYRYRPDEVWPALTDAERLGQWFKPVTGDLRLGGRYQFEGNAGGRIESCDRPHSIMATWEFGGRISWVEVRIGDVASEHASVELRHEAHPDPIWEEYGPGATGPGWDINFTSLQRHLATGEPVVEDEWVQTPGGKAAVRYACDEWGRAAVRDGTDPDRSVAEADRSYEFWTAGPES